MAIIYPLTMPTDVKGLSAITWTKVDNQNMTQSPFSGAQQVQRSQAQWWEAAIGLPPLTKAQADAWEAFLFSLDGSSGTFLLGDPEHADLSGAGALGAHGSPAVRSDGQTGTSLDIKGLDPNVTAWAMPGDFFQVGDTGSARLHRILQQVDSDSDGNATLNFWPKLRYSPPLDSPITTQNCVGLFRLKPDALSIQRVPVFTSLSFNAVEALSGS